MRLASCHGKKKKKKRSTAVMILRKNTAQTLVGKLGFDLQYLCKRVFACYTWLPVKQCGAHGHASPCMTLDPVVVCIDLLLFIGSSPSETSCQAVQYKARWVKRTVCGSHIPNQVGGLAGGAALLHTYIYTVDYLSRWVLLRTSSNVEYHLCGRVRFLFGQNHASTNESVAPLSSPSSPDR